MIYFVGSLDNSFGTSLTHQLVSFISVFSKCLVYSKWNFPNMEKGKTISSKVLPIYMEMHWNSKKDPFASALSSPFILSGISVIRGFILFLNNLSIFTFFKTLSIRPILKPILELRLNDTWHVFWHLPLSLTRISVRHLLSKLQITLSNRCRCSRVTCQLFILPLVSATIVKAQIKSGEKSMHLYYRQKGNNFALRFSLCSIWVSTIHSKNAF